MQRLPGPVPGRDSVRPVQEFSGAPPGVATGQLTAGRREPDRRLSGKSDCPVYTVGQRADVAAFKRDEAILLDESIDYATLSGLSQELRGKLAAVQPTTLGQAARIEGITPAAITLLAAHARRRGARMAAGARELEELAS